MRKKLHILLIFSNFVVEIKSKSQENHMYNFCAKFRQILDICKRYSENLVNSLGNVPRVGVVPRFSDLEVIALSLTAEAQANFSQLCDQFLFIRNYAKNVDGLFTRIIGKISAFTVLQYINKINNKPIGQIKYALV